MIDVSLVIPVFNEEETLIELKEKLLMSSKKKI